MADSSVAQDSTTGQGWIHVAADSSANINEGVAGPFTGDGLVQLIAGGFRVYHTQQAAAAAAPQKLDSAQAHILAQVLGEGPGIGQGFFGLSGDAGKVASGFTNALGLAEIGHWIGELVSHLADKYMWISLGWLLLGIALLLLGVNLLFGLSGKIPGLKGAAAAAGARTGA